MFEPTQAPLAVCSRHSVQHVNAAAAECGVAVGMKRATALAVCAQLVLEDGSPAREMAALQAVATSLLVYTPSLSLQPASGPQAHGLLLEVSHCLRLFGGLPALLGKVRATVGSLGHHCICAVMPTAQAAWVMAQGGHERVERDLGRVPVHLQALPAPLLGLNDVQQDRLRSIGVHTIGDLLRLPRAGVSRRLSQAVLDQLDRALGHKPDPRAWFSVPQVFHAQLDLTARVDSSEALLFAANRLATQLLGWLAARQLAAQQIVLRMTHEDLPPSLLEIGFMQPTRSQRHLCALVKERVLRLQLAAPVYELELLCPESRPLPGASQSLFPLPQQGDEALVLLIERLRARLGEHRLAFARITPDFRPERAVQWQAEPAPPGGPPGEMHKFEPLWLLAKPVALKEARNMLVHRSVLRRIGAPQRLECGWWDSAPAQRDYYIAQDSQQRWVWVFRTRGALAQAGNPTDAPAAGWYLHGHFG
ncbi:MAG: DNA polymerase Y family protein [Betaproteobacteria bacterium]|nr:DNA polymerase Y family protein [Betaproteobacteria bacterium]